MGYSSSFVNAEGKIYWKQSSSHVLLSFLLNLYEYDIKKHTENKEKTVVRNGVYSVTDT